MIILDVTNDNDSRSENHLDELTRARLKDSSFNNEVDYRLVDKVTGFAFCLGLVAGIILASFLHKYIVHPLGF